MNLEKAIEELEIECTKLTSEVDNCDATIEDEIARDNKAHEE